MALCCLSAAIAAETSDTPFTEYKVKALFIFNIAKYVEWPDSSFSGTNAPITIGIVGKDRFGSELRNVVANRHVDERSFTILHFTAEDDFRGCQILFISNSEDSRTGTILSKVAGLPVLTVGEDTAFSRAGGMIEMALKTDQVRLEINRAAANRAGLKISSRLLSIAEVTDK